MNAGRNYGCESFKNFPGEINTECLKVGHVGLASVGLASEDPATNPRIQFSVDSLWMRPVSFLHRRTAWGVQRGRREPFQG
jgi:hypothetical protein